MWLFVTAFVYFLKGPNANCSATPQSLQVVNLLKLPEKSTSFLAFWKQKWNQNSPLRIRLFYVRLTVHLELYLDNKKTRCTICPHFIE
jgi:hypothetical protein